MNELSDEFIEHCAKEFAVKQLLNLKNSEWLDNDEAPVSELGFKSRLALESIERGDQNIEVWFKDGGLFYGHSICVRLDFNGKGVSSDLYG